MARVVARVVARAEARVVAAMRASCEIATVTVTVAVVVRMTRRRPLVPMLRCGGVGQVVVVVEVGEGTRLGRTRRRCSHQ